MSVSLRVYSPSPASARAGRGHANGGECRKNPALPWYILRFREGGRCEIEVDHLRRLPRAQLDKIPVSREIVCRARPPPLQERRRGFARANVGFSMGALGFD